MLIELAVRNLGVIEEARLLLGPGLTALTGETGAGKTLVTEAMLLLAGGRADPGLVRTGAAEAEVEGRFLTRSDGTEATESDEVVVRRVIPVDGRSRAYVDGRLATATAVADAVGDLIELHGQHGHHLLLRPPARRAALDRFGGIDTTKLREARLAVQAGCARRADFGGDARVRAREIELLTFQLEELESAGLTSAEEDQELIAEERLLGDSSAHREASLAAGSLLSTDGVVGDGLARAFGLLKEREPFAAESTRIEGLLAEATELAAELRGRADNIPDDPARLIAVGERRRQLTELRRKYGATLAEVIAYEAEAAERLELLRSFEERSAALESEIAELEAVEAGEAAKVAKLRRKAAPKMAAQVQDRLVNLALPNASIEVTVGDDPGDDVDFLVSMNPGMAPGPVARVASGGELSRLMLSLQLVVADAPPTMIFDEVDAGVGGQAATAVGEALARVATDRQVLVVTHLPQVAAFAHNHVVIEKSTAKGDAVTTLAALDETSRVVELSRMLSGSPESETAQEHAAELLAAAQKDLS